ncbi:DNA damage-regulated autophagy modulator protein 1 isoform X1 [Octopus sinensis]|uniref:DNA damage-regulated autophagy modulator protein 1 isoform X1 n=2 Tax=Octopus sinensis TaxID=2607531 RepID=A0A7E6FNI2_9MOLL|nr:DNA damage-regulated autophagy modulator protein 1 isoform X1 [Octopus sinensis]
MGPTTTVFDYAMSFNRENRKRVFSMCFLLGLEMLPISLVVVTFLTFITTYVISVSNGHVTPYLPYISDTGAKSPESCIFGQLLTFSTIIALFTLYIRFKLIQSLVNVDNSRIHVVNKVSFGLGIIAALGMSLVGNFQESNVLVVHVIGAFMVFGIGSVYEIFQTIMSYMMYPMYNGKKIIIIRMVLSIFSVFFFIMTFIGAGLAGKEYKGNPLAWRPEDEGFSYHILSTSCEWLLSVSFLAYFLTFIHDFQKIKINVVGVMSVTHLDQSPSIIANDDSLSSSNQNCF